MKTQLCGLMLIAAAALSAQDATVKTDPPPQKADTPQKTDASKDQSAAASPVPAGENILSGSIDFGYRFLAGPGGSLDAYRSIVNLGAGPKLIGTDFTITDPKHRFFDQIHVRAYNWGDEPYETLHFDMKKSGVYNFNADYRDFAYFNYLPSYADPLLGRGITLDEQSFDERRKLAAFSLDLLPQSRFVPYFAFDRDSNSGHGATAFVTDANEFPVPTLFDDATNLYRGGVRIELRRFHATLEEGGTTFADNQSVYQNSGTNPGNNSSLIFGQSVTLANLMAAYGITGSSMFSRGLFTASPASWIDLYGQFLYSEPQTTVHYTQTDAGNLYLQSQILFYTGQQYLLNSAAKLPHTTANAGIEIRPLKRVRITESWLTDRMHDNGSAGLNQVFTGISPSTSLATLLASTLVNNYNQNEVDIYWNPISRLTLRGGYRYVWGDANQVILPVAGLSNAVSGNLKRNVGIGGLTYRASQKLSLTAEAEAASSDGAYFRTSLYNYQKVRAQARYSALNSLTFSADFTALKNQNPLAGTTYSFSSIQESASVMWNPKGGKNFDFLGTYTRYDLYADIGYLNPLDLSQQIDHYRERGNSATALIDLICPKFGSNAPKFSAGGSFYVSSGSRPTSYFQPLARLSVPLGKHVNWFSEWRYYGYGETFYLYEGFRAHLVTTGLRLIR